MDAFINFLTFLSENWTMILMVVTAVVAIVSKTRKWIRMDKKQKKDAILEIVRRTMLYLVTEAEREYGGGTGSLKRADVLAKVFEKYPILAQYGNVDTIVKQLDYMIDDNLVVLKDLLENNPAFYDLMNNVLTLDADVLEDLAIGNQIGGEVRKMMAAEAAEESDVE